MNSATLKNISTEGTRTSWTLDSIVFGMLITHWADSGIETAEDGSIIVPCMRGWASEWRSRTITVGNDRWSAGPVTKDRKRGVQFIRNIDALNGGKAQEVWWIPMRSFQKAMLTLEGVERIIG